jgi:predicted PurR-regulated permease PerM
MSANDNQSLPSVQWDVTTGAPSSDKVERRSERLGISPAALATVGVLGLTAYVLQYFLLPLIWGVILAVATWPMYRVLRRRLSPTTAALLMTIFITLCTVVPIVELSNVAVHETGYATKWAKSIAHNGLPYPSMFDKLPIADSLHAWWNENLAEGSLLTAWVEELVTEKFYGLSQVLQKSGFWLLHRLANLMFTMIALFFFFRDGLKITAQIEAFCRRRLGARWVDSLRRVPLAIRATVDGVVLVGIVIGALVGAGYALVNVGSPVLLGTLTAAAAMIPFAAPLVYGTVALYLGFTGKVLAGVLLFAWSHAVFSVLDHFVRPIIIGNTTRMPFLLVLFGILGGIETMGLIGLFIGPIAMVTFLTWWRVEVGNESANSSPLPGKNGEATQPAETPTVPHDTQTARI